MYVNYFCRLGCFIKNVWKQTILLCVLSVKLDVGTKLKRKPTNAGGAAWGLVGAVLANRGCFALVRDWVRVGVGLFSGTRNFVAVALWCW